MEFNLMSDGRPNYHNHIYSAVVLFGIVICITAVYMSESKIEFFEHNTNRIHRLITASEIELDTLDREANSIETTLSDIKTKIKQQKKIDKPLTKTFLSLKENIEYLNADIAEKQKLLISLNLLKTSTLSQIKTLFWINSALLVIGSLMIIFGVAALGFRLEIFEERRNKKRASSEQP